MRILLAIALWSFAAGAGYASPSRLPAAQQVVDRIVATVENDVITLSEVRELGAFNQLTSSSQISDEELLQRLINQWIVTNDAAGSRFTGPTAEEIESAYTELVAQFASPDDFAARLRMHGLNDAAVRRQLTRQLFLARYLDHKYRFVVRVDDAAVEAFYRETLTPQLAARGETAPRLETVSDQIREVLTQQEITRIAERWLDESRTRLRIELRGGGRRP